MTDIVLETEDSRRQVCLCCPLLETTLSFAVALDLDFAKKTHKTAENLVNDGDDKQTFYRDVLNTFYTPYSLALLKTKTTLGLILTTMNSSIAER